MLEIIRNFNILAKFMQKYGESLAEGEMYTY